MEEFIRPRTITFIATYRCTAACEQCCFECTPKSQGQLTGAQIRKFLSVASAAFPSLQVAVFTGGEATLLKQELLESITQARALNLSTRLVSNGHWGRSPKSASAALGKLVSAGLNELNLSTGLDHQKWIPATSILNAASAAASEGIPCIISIEADVQGHPHYSAIADSPITKDLVSRGLLALQVNTWINFRSSDHKRNQRISKQSLDCGCNQVFNNITVTPFARVLTCCGLTSDQIPSMDLGPAEELVAAYRSQANDFLKYWLSVEGPYRILQHASDSGSLERDYIHPCEACRTLHDDERTKSILRERYTAHIKEVMTRFSISHAINLAARKDRMT